jgi:hypothetical protein
MTNEFGRLCSHPILVAVVAIITLFAPAGFTLRLNRAGFAGGCFV